MNRRTRPPITAYHLQRQHPQTAPRPNRRRMRGRSSSHARRQQRITESFTELENVPPTSTRTTRRHTYQGNIPAIGSPWENPPEGAARVYFGNKNGIYINDDGAEIMNDLNFLDTGNTMVAMFAEPNIDWTFPGARRAFSRYVRRAWEHVRIVTSCSGRPSARGFLVGGTALLVQGRWTGRVSETGQDAFGRWTWATVEGKGCRTTFIAAYAPCTGGISLGNDTWWKQLWFRHRAALQRPSPDPRKLFWDDLLRFIESKQGPSSFIDLGLDANEDLTETRDGLARVAQQCRLVDVLRQFHGNNLPPTYAHSRHRLDYRFISSGLLTRGAVIGCGSLALNYGIISDHTGIFIDYDEEAMLRTDTAELLSRSAQRLDSRREDTTTKYVDALWEQLEHHDLISQSTQLLRNFERQGATPDNVQRYDALEDQFDRACRHAERLCRRLPAHGKYFSPTLQRAGRTIAYWKARRAAAAEGFALPVYLSDLRRSLKINDSGECTDEYISQQYKKAWRNLRDCQKNAKKLRKDFLSQLAETAAHRDNVSVEVAIRRIMEAERTRELYASLHFMREESPVGAIKRLKIPNPTDPHADNPKKCRSWIDVPDDEMNEVLIKSNRQQFRKAADTPFADGPLGALLRNPSIRQSILNGSFDASAHSSDTILHDFLDAFRHTDESRGAQPIIVDMTDEEWITKHKSVSPRKAVAGRHRGHWKAILDDPKLVSFRRQMEMLPFQRGFSPLRWRQMIECMLEKVAGLPHLGRLRQIALVDHAYNTGLKVLYSDRAMHRAESLAMVGNGQIGGRKGHQAIQGALLQTLTTDIHRHSLHNYMRLNYDATGCYDLMNPAVTSLGTERLGLPSSVNECNAQTLALAERRVRTAQGLSEPYSGDGHRLYGHGQGKGDAGASWVIQSFGMFGVMAKRTHCIEVASVDGSIKRTQAMLGFIDDALGGVTSVWQGRDDELALLKDSAEESAQTWEHVLYLTGGLLEYNKSFVQPGIWEHDGDTPRLMSVEDLGLEEGLVITNSRTGEIVNLRAIDPTSAERYLGVMTRLDGDQAAEVERLRNISTAFCGIFSTNRMTPHQARTLFDRILLPKLTYSLPATRLTPKDCDRIMTSVRSIAIARMGFNRCSAHAVMFGPEEFGGNGLLDLYTEQGIAGLIQLIGSVRSGSDLGDYFKILLSHAQQWAGIATPVLEECNIPLPHLPPSVVTHVREFLACINGRLVLPDIWTPQKAYRKYDLLLMEVVPSWLTPTQLVRFNNCRLYLRALTISDLSSTYGDTIEPAYLSGALRVESWLRWPDIAKPPPAHWAIFRKGIFSAFAPAFKGRGRLPRRIPLAHPLGPWLPARHHKLHRWWIQDRKDRIIEIAPESGQLQQYKKHAFRLGYQRIRRRPRRLPPDAVPVAVHVTDLVRPINHTAPRPAPPTRKPTSLRALIDNLPEHLRRALGEITIPEDEFSSLAYQVSTGRAILVSDGSVKRGQGSSAWRIAFRRSARQCDAHAAAPCDGDPSTMSSYRAELNGLLGGLIFTTLLLRYHQFPIPEDGTFEVHCDNTSAIEALTPNKIHGIRTTLAAEFDLVNEIHLCLTNASLSVKPCHVAGHQDREVEFNSLPFPAQCNVLCDEAAGEFLHDPPVMFDPQPTALCFPSNPATLFLDDRVVTSDIAQQIRLAHRGRILRDFTIEKESKRDPMWSISTWHLIDFPARFTAYRRESPGIKRRLIKLQYRWLPVGTRQFDAVTTPQITNCPCCPSPETHEHLFQCQAAMSLANYRLQLTLLRRFLQSTHILPIVWTVFSQELSFAMGFGEEPTYSLPNDLTGRTLEVAVDEQRRIGWLNTFKGWLSTHWGHAMQPYYSQRFPDEKKHNAMVFQIRLIRGLWRFFDGIWTQRNCLVHDSDSASKTRDLDTQIRQLYRRRNHLVSNADRALFTSLPIEECLHLSNRTKSTWIEFVHQAIKLKHGSLDPITAELNTVTNYFERSHRREWTTARTRDQNAQEG